MATDSGSKQRPQPPTRGAIVAYWRAQEAIICPTWDKAKNHCWRCARKFGRNRSAEDGDCGHRAHIVPAALGGTYEPSNFVLLCRGCHLESPDVADPDFMWEWICKMMGRSDRDYENWLMSVWTYERIYDEFPNPRLGAGFLCMQFPHLARQLQISPGSTDEEEAAKQLEAKNWFPVLQSALQKTSLHYGRLSATSMAWALRQAVLFVEGKPSQVDPETVKTKIAEWTEWATDEERKALLESALVSPYEQGESPDKSDSDHEPESED